MPGNVQDYELLLRVRADMLQAISGLDGVRKKLDTVGTETERTAKRASDSVDSIGKKFDNLKTLIAGLAIGAGIRAVVDAVTDSEDAIAQLDARLKSTGGAAGLTREQLIELSDAMEGLTRFGASAVLGMENLLLSFTNIRGPIFQQATRAVLDMSTALGQDLKASANQVGRALNDPIKGIAELRTVGVNFTTDQIGLITALVHTGNAADAQGLILEELQRKFGGAAEAAAQTFGGALAQLKNAADDLLQGDGGNLPEVTTSVKELTRTLQDPAVKQGFNDLVSGFLTAASKAATFVANVGATTKFLAESAARAQGNLAAGDTTGLEDRNAAIQRELDAREGLFKGYFHRIKVLGNAYSPVAGLRQLFGQNIVQDADLAKKTTAELNAELVRNNQLLAAGAAFRKSSPSSAPRPKGSSGPTQMPDLVVTASPIKEAANAAAELNSANEKLASTVDALREQTLSPTEKIWNDYAKAVRAAGEAGGEAIAKGADVAAVQQQVAEAVNFAAITREAAIKKQSDESRQAFDKLRDSLRTPAEVKLDDAIAKIKELNAALVSGNVKGPQYNQMLQQIGQQSVGDSLPSYQGVAPEVAGVGGEITKNIQAGQDLDKAYQQEQLDLRNKYRSDDLAQQTAYLAAKAQLDQDYATKSATIEQSRQTLTLQASSDFFGNLAELQHSSNKKIATVGKAAAIAQAMIKTYQSATEAYAAMASIPYVGPALGIAAAAAAVAAGLANVAQIRSQSTGFDTGGYTGPGGVHEPAGVVHRGEVVWSQADIKRAGGVGVVEAMRLGYAGYADGGFVSPMASTAGFVAPSSAGMPALPTDTAADAAPQVHNNFRFITAFDANDLAEKILATPSGERLVVHHVIANGSAVKSGIG